MPRSQFQQSGANRKVAEHNFYDFRYLRPTSGNIFFVDSNVTVEGNGLSPESAFNTLVEAVAACTANNGDIIIVMEGHAENVAGAIGININVAGVTIIGLGHGNARPVFSFTAAASTFQIDAANVRIENLVFVGNFTNGTTAAIDVKTAADDLTFYGCEWRETVNTKELLKAVTIEATISRVTFDQCRFKAVIGGDSVAAIFAEGAITDLRVINCSFNGDWTGGAIDADAAAITTPEFGNLVIRNADPSAGLAIAVDAATIGTFWNIRALTEKANTVPVATITASFFADCVGTDVAATSGLVFPATATAWS